MPARARSAIAPVDLCPTPGGRGDPKARALLAQAGYPDGLTLGFAIFGSGTLAAGNKAYDSRSASTTTPASTTTRS